MLGNALVHGAVLEKYNRIVLKMTSCFTCRGSLYNPRDSVWEVLIYRGEAGGGAFPERSKLEITVDPHISIIQYILQDLIEGSVFF